MKKQQQSGFTLIELVVVIVILGILAAIAMPRFSSMTNEARTATVNGLRGAVESAAAIAHATSLAQNNPTPITMEGQAVDMVNQYPAGTAEGIGAAVRYTGFTINTDTAGTVIFQATGANNPATCSVTYVAAASVNAAPTISTQTGGCL